jgi:endoglucanase Acf2
MYPFNQGKNTESKSKNLKIAFTTGLMGEIKISKKFMDITIKDKKMAIDGNKHFFKNLIKNGFCS